MSACVCVCAAFWGGQGRCEFAGLLQQSCTSSKSHDILTSIEGKVNFEFFKSYYKGYFKMAEEALIPPPEKISSVSSVALHGTNHHQIMFLKWLLNQFYLEKLRPTVLPQYCQCKVMHWLIAIKYKSWSKLVLSQFNQLINVHERQQHVQTTFDVLYFFIIFVYPQCKYKYLPN